MLRVVVGMRLQELHVGRGWTREGLTVFPVWSPAVLDSRGYVVGGPLEVAERPDGPAVGQLVVSNGGDRPALVLEGEVLHGGWQDRVANHSVLVPAHDTWALEVSCVEQGRWGGDSRHARSGRRVPPGIRAAAGRPQTPHTTDRQGEVWRRVHRYEQAWRPSVTSSLPAVAAQARGAARALVADLRPLPGQAGVLIGLAGQPLLLEVFDSPRTLAKTWRELLLAAATEALAARAAGTAPVTTPGRRARRFADRVLAVGLDVTAPAGAGDTLSGASPYAHARGLHWRDHLVHLVAVNSRHDLALAA